MSTVASEEFNSIMSDACAKAGQITAVGGGDIQAIILSVVQGAVEGRELDDDVRQKIDSMVHQLELKRRMYR